MKNKKAYTYITAALLTLVIVVALSQISGLTIKNILVAVVTYAMIGLLAAVYLLRFVLIFWGVFALYRMLQQRYSQQFEGSPRT